MRTVKLVSVYFYANLLLTITQIVWMEPLLVIVGIEGAAQCLCSLWFILSGTGCASQPSAAVDAAAG